MLLNALRAATRPHHDAIESELDLLGREWDLAGYKRLLAGFYGYIAVQEPQLLAKVEWSAADYNVSVRRKLPLLVQDLAYLNGAESVAALPVVGDVPPLTGFPESLGYLYVMEGSTLGGQLISRQFKQRLGIEPESGGAYFHGYGEQTSVRWRETVAFLESAPESFAPEDREAFIERAVESANTTFIHLREWLRQTI